MDCALSYTCYLCGQRKKRDIFSMKKSDEDVKLNWTSMIFISEAISIITRRNTLCKKKFCNFFFLLLDLSQFFIQKYSMLVVQWGDKAGEPAPNANFG